MVVCLLQFFADADDVDTWMLDTLRLVSSEDVGQDEASVQSLIKKHKVGLYPHFTMLKTRKWRGLVTIYVAFFLFSQIKHVSLNQKSS